MTLAVLTASEMKQVETWTREKCGISESNMIAQAGQAVFNTARSLHSSYARPGSRPWVFVCGKGHNGADGIQAALLARSRGFKVKVFQLFSEKGYSPETRLLHDKIKRAKLKIQPVKKAEDLQFPQNTALVIDGLLGAGITREAAGITADCIRLINQSTLPVLSIDIPSGLFTDESEVGLHVHAMATMSLGTLKLSAIFYPSCQRFGSIYFDSLCFPESQLRLQPSRTELFRKEDAYEVYPERAYDAHKYSTGKVLIIAGSKGMHGAAVLSAHAALKAGAGMVKLAVPSGLHNEICHHTVEIISLPIGKRKTSSGKTGEDAPHFSQSHVKELLPLIEWADAVLLGPGLGKHADTIKFLLKLVPEISTRLVVDGDGLQFFCPAANKGIGRASSSFKQVIATPHAGEFKRMGGTYRYDSPLQHLQHAKSISKKYGLNVLLKGPTSIITSHDGTSTILPSGNPGLATAGSGDVLAGIITALLCLLDPVPASGLGVYIHSASADLARHQTGILGMTASDVLNHIPAVIREIEDEKAN
ncbi:NAD(P)H-hydrate dehydratase [Fibrobacterota bacterium]